MDMQEYIHIYEYIYITTYSPSPPPCSLTYILNINFLFFKFSEAALKGNFALVYELLDGECDGLLFSVGSPILFLSRAPLLFRMSLSLSACMSIKVQFE